MAGQTAPPLTRMATSFTARLRDEAARQQRALERNLRDPEALIAMSLIALASRQTGAAVRMAQAAVALFPGIGRAWVALGQALRAEQRPLESEQAYQAATRIDGMDPLARLGLGEVKLATQRPAEALPEFELALRGDPLLIAAHLGMGHALACLKRYSDALASYERALELRPGNAEAEFAAGYALARLGRTAEAERRYRRALALRPDFTAVWMNLGCLLREQGQDLYARAALERSLELCPTLIAAWINLAILERECERMDEAEAALRRAFALDPTQVETHLAWVQFSSACGDRAAAWGWLRWALAQDDSHDEALNMFGILLHNERQFDEAVETFERAESAGNTHAASNRGNSLLELGRMDEALAAHEAAVARESHSAGARYNLALTELRLGRWADGWRNYEARWSFREVHREPRAFVWPRWQGEALHGQRILLHAEQGLGDTIQFCRYAALVAERGGIPVLEVQAPLERLMRSLNVVRAGLAEVCALGDEIPPVHLECPLMSLPAVFATTLDRVPWCGPYLAAPDEKIARKSALLDPRPDDRLRVGIAWAGNPRYKADAQRSMHLATLLPLLRMPDILWISLQKGPAAEQINDLPPDVDLLDACSHDADLAETAVLVSTLDLVITTDTSIAHLAGALGKPVWILLPHLSDWRWMQARETTPWYPSAWLVRQIVSGDWPGVLSRLRAKLSRNTAANFESPQFTLRPQLP